MWATVQISLLWTRTFSISLGSKCHSCWGSLSTSSSKRCRSLPSRHQTDPSTVWRLPNALWNPHLLNGPGRHRLQPLLHDGKHIFYWHCIKRTPRREHCPDSFIGNKVGGLPGGMRGGTVVAQGSVLLLQHFDCFLLQHGHVVFRIDFPLFAERIRAPMLLKLLFHPRKLSSLASSLMVLCT